MQHKLWMSFLLAGLLFLLPKEVFAQGGNVYFDDTSNNGRDTPTCGMLSVPCATIGQARFRSCQLSEADEQKARFYYYHVLGGKYGSCRSSGSGFEDEKLGIDYDPALLWSYLLRKALIWFLLGSLIGIGAQWMRQRRKIPNAVVST